MTQHLRPSSSLARTAIAVLLLAASAAWCPRVAADTYPRQPGIDAQHYVFRLTLLTGESNEIQGEATVRLRLVTGGVREAFLDFVSARPDGKGMTVTSATSAGQSVQFEHRDNRLRLAVPPGIKTGEDVSFTIAYRGVPANGLRLLNNIHGDRTAFSENWFNQARQWLPMIDHPADKATGEFIVTTRADYQVVGNGALVEQLDLAGRAAADALVAVSADLVVALLDRDRTLRRAARSRSSAACRCRSGHSRRMPTKG